MEKIYILPLLALVLTAAVVAACIASMQTLQAEPPETRRLAVKAFGLPSIAVGASYRATRNPLLETYCTSLYDMPGGYCYIYTASFIGTPMRDPAFTSAIPGFHLKALKE